MTLKEYFTQLFTMHGEYLEREGRTYRFNESKNRLSA